MAHHRIAQLKRRTGATLFVMAGDHAALEPGVYIGSEDVGASRFPAVQVDRALTDGSTVTLGGVILTPKSRLGRCGDWKPLSRRNLCGKPVGRADSAGRQCETGPVRVAHRTR